jgi:hypothetical protein
MTLISQFWASNPPRNLDSDHRGRVNVCRVVDDCAGSHGVRVSLPSKVPGSLIPETVAHYRILVKPGEGGRRGVSPLVRHRPRVRRFCRAVFEQHQAKPLPFGWELIATGVREFLTIPGVDERKLRIR